MLATAVAMNLKGSSMNVKEEAADASPMVAAIMGGMNMRHYLSTGMAATPENCNGVPFNASHVYASGNLAADMLANVMAESTGRVLACRLYEMTDDAGMKDMISFLIARDTLHQQQWLAVLEELGGLQNVLPIPNSFPQSQEMQEVSYAYVATGIKGTRVPEGRFTSGPSLDGKGEFSLVQAAPMAASRSSRRRFRKVTRKPKTFKPDAPAPRCTRPNGHNAAGKSRRFGRHYGQHQRHDFRRLEIRLNKKKRGNKSKYAIFPRFFNCYSILAFVERLILGFVSHYCRTIKQSGLLRFVLPHQELL